jgi:Tol biopolymer transport system component
MILVITDHPSGHGGDDLYVLRRDGDGWTSPVNAGPGVNSPDYEYGPTLSRDGQHILFASHRGENANVYRVPVAALQALIR